MSEDKNPEPESKPEPKPEPKSPETITPIIPKVPETPRPLPSDGGEVVEKANVPKKPQKD